MAKKTTFQEQVKVQENINALNKQKDKILSHAKSYDEKIIAIPFNDPMYNMYKDIDELPKHIFEEMRHFFTVYKELEGKQTAVNEASSSEAALGIIQAAVDNYIEKFCKG